LGRNGFRLESGQFRAAFQTFETTDIFEQQIEQLLRQWMELHSLLGARPSLAEGEGLAFSADFSPFEADHAAVFFFGRDGVIDEARRSLTGAAERGTPFSASGRCERRRQVVPCTRRRHFRV